MRILFPLGIIVRRKQQIETDDDNKKRCENKSQLLFTLAYSLRETPSLTASVLVVMNE